MPSSTAPGDRLVDPLADRPSLVALVDKYDRMLALRRVLGRGTRTLPHRGLLRSLAADYPGALRELEQLRTDEIETRRVCSRAAAGGLVPEWLLWTARYHARMRALMADKRAGVAPELAERHGRMNVVVFHALAAELGVPAEVIWQRLFPSISARPHRRG